MTTIFMQDIHTDLNQRQMWQITGSKANEDISKLLKCQNSKATGQLQLLHSPGDGEEHHDSL